MKRYIIETFLKSEQCSRNEREKNWFLSAIVSGMHSTQLLVRLCHSVEMWVTTYSMNNVSLMHSMHRFFALSQIWNIEWTNLRLKLDSFSLFLFYECLLFRIYATGSSKMHFGCLILVCALNKIPKIKAKREKLHSVVLRFVHVMHWSIVRVAKMVQFYLLLFRSFIYLVMVDNVNIRSRIVKERKANIYSCLHIHVSISNFRKLHSQRKQSLTSQRITLNKRNILLAWMQKDKHMCLSMIKWEQMR